MAREDEDREEPADFKFEWKLDHEKSGKVIDLQSEKHIMCTI